MTASVADQATLNINGEEVHLWQRGMFAIMFEIEVGFRFKYAGDFCKLTGASA